MFWLFLWFFMSHNLWIMNRKWNFTEFSKIQTWGQSQASRSLILNIISHLFVLYFHAKCALRNGVILIVIGNNFHAFHPFVHYCNDSEINMHDDRTIRIGQSCFIFEKWNKNWSKMIVWITNEVQNQNYQLLKNDPFNPQQIA